MRLYTILILCILVCQYAHADFDWNKNCRDAYSSIISLKFKQAQQLLDIEKGENPDNSLVYLIEDYIDYLSIQIGEEHSFFEQKKEFKNSRLTAIENDQSSSPWYLYSQAEIHLHWASNRLKFGEYITAAYELRKAYKLVRKNDRLYPDFLPNKKSLGLLYSLIGSVPQQYQWILSVVGMQGNLNEGLTLLENTIQRMKTDTLFSCMYDETYFLYSFLKMNLDNNQDDLKSILDDIRNSRNLLLNFAASRLASLIGQNDMAIEILENRDKSDEFFHFVYLEYLLGLAKINQINKEGIGHLETYIQEFNGNNYKKSALMRMSWYAYINDDLENYITYKQHINSVGSLLVDADIEAQHFFKSQHTPNKVLLKARLYFDGSYFKKCLDELLKIDLSTNHLQLYDELDYYYRFARVHEQLGDVDTAIIYYEKALKKGAQETYFFAAKSALQLGLIYEKKSDFINAKYFFNSCIDLTNHLYEQSIEQKAKAGLDRLN